jgi:hypothetical protein
LTPEKHKYAEDAKETVGSVEKLRNGVTTVETWHDLGKRRTDKAEMIK